MEKAALLFLILFISGTARPQNVQVIVPRQVVAGNAFQLQYIVRNPAQLVDIGTPRSDDLRLISGPNHYRGSAMVDGKMQAIENITYTVVPVKPGPIRIGPVTARFRDGSEEQTGESVIDVLPQPRASFNAYSSYTDFTLYTPSSREDLERLISENLFIRTTVDKHVCFTGEAITVSFTLYSRLQSTSEVINAPSLYGFSVMDMLDINQAHPGVEQIDGKIFNTSVLRKLQLYPAQTGRLTIDEMQLQNEIEFRDSGTGRITKLTKMLSSPPVQILVKPLPASTASDYTGAVGLFTMAARFQNERLRANEQGQLMVTIAGKGNFIQFGPPQINWPQGLEVFDPSDSDLLNKNTVPVEGSRTYAFAFTTAHPGRYWLAPFTFSFFDPGSGRYRQLRSDSLSLDVLAAAGSTGARRVPPSSPSSHAFFYGLLLLCLLLCGGLVWLIRRKREVNRVPPAQQPSYRQQLEGIISSGGGDRGLCLALFKLLAEVSRKGTLSPEQKDDLLSIQRDCQLLMYSEGNAGIPAGEIMEKADRLLRQLDG